MKPINVLVVDDEFAEKKSFQVNFQEELNLSNSNVIYTGSREEAEAKLKESPQHYDLIIVDIILRVKEGDPSQEGFKFLENHLKPNSPEKFVVISAHITQENFPQKRYIIKNKNFLGFYPKKHDQLENLKKVIATTFPDLEVTPLGFNYSQLDSETAQLVRSRTLEIKSRGKKLVQETIMIGKLLFEVKKSLKYGLFREWVKQELDIPLPTCSKFMKIASQFGDVDFSELNIVSSALDILAPSNVPQEARNELIKRAQAGETIDIAAAKEIKQKYVPPKKQPTLLSKSSSELVTTAKPKPTTPDVPFESKTQTPEKRSSLSKGQIIAIRKSSEQKKSAQDLTVEKGSMWQLGEHFLFCGDSLSPQFQRKLPKIFPLLLAFPSRYSDYWPAAIAERAQSVISHYTGSKIKDLELFGDFIQNSLELHTKPRQPIVVVNFPDPILLIIFHDLKCHSFIAEPDPQLCQQTIHLWSNMGGKVVKKDV